MAVCEAINDRRLLFSSSFCFERIIDCESAFDHNGASLNSFTKSIRNSNVILFSENEIKIHSNDISTGFRFQIAATFISQSTSAITLTNGFYGRHGDGEGLADGRGGRTPGFKSESPPISALPSCDFRVFFSLINGRPHKCAKKEKETKLSILAVSPSEHSTDLHATHIHNNNKYLKTI